MFPTSRLDCEVKSLPAFKAFVLFLTLYAFSPENMLGGGGGGGGLFFLTADGVIKDTLQSRTFVMNSYFAGCFTFLMM